LFKDHTAARIASIAQSRVLAVVLRHVILTILL